MLKYFFMKLGCNVILTSTIISRFHQSWEDDPPSVGGLVRMCLACVQHIMQTVTALNVTGGEWRLKYERAIREIEFTKKRLQQEFDDKLEVEQQNKRQLERRVSGR